MIQWIGRTPESFTVDPEGAVHELLPEPEGRWRWWWDHRELASEVDERRQNQGMTWHQVADEVGLPLGNVKGFGKGKYGPPIGIAMIAARWVQRSAASFMTETPPALNS